MVKKIKIGKCNIEIVLRHRFEKQEFLNRDFERWRIGLWFKKREILGKNNFNKPSKWGENLVNSYMFGLDFLLFKTFISIDYNGMHL